eukprot:TRINITY_DN454_c0_g3_i1.p1 TRINITY_DN454_c0_g3~~TRINITY_DN454_c0_g3_i1.p1  ORF type:complete len:437 (+),score=222.84 TRINITY_DN454_c0_g3_i1:38-1348(+)
MGDSLEVVPDRFGAKKALVLYMFKNGNKYDTGTRVVLNSRIKKWDQFLNECSDRVKLNTGPVRKIYDSKGNKITEFKQLEDKEEYVCCGNEGIKASSVPFQKSGVKINPRTPGSAGRNSGATARLSDQKKGTVVYIFRNGDKYHSGTKFVIHKSKYKTFDQLLTDVTRRVGVNAGVVRKIMAPNNTRVTKLDDFEEDNSYYIACGGEKLNLEASSPKIAEESGSSFRDTASPYQSPNSKKNNRQKYGVKKDKGKRIKVFENNDIHHAGIGILVNADRYKKFDQLLKVMSAKLNLSTGPVKTVYDVSGNKITSLDEIEDGGSYLGAAGGEKFANLKYKHFPIAKQESNNNNNNDDDNDEVDDTNVEEDNNNDDDNNEVIDDSKEEPEDDNNDENNEDDNNEDDDTPVIAGEDDNNEDNNEDDTATTGNDDEDDDDTF